MKTKSLFFAYDQQAEFRFSDIELSSGESLLILGESGVGKTTLLHLIAGLLHPISGSVEILDTSIHDLSMAELDRFRGKHIGIVFQRPRFIQALSVQENLELVQFLAGKPKDKKRIVEVVESLGMSHKLKKNPSELSQGEQQRLSIAIAVINSPQLILADEPTSSLDNKNCAKVATLLKEQASTAGSQLIIITHDQRLKDQFQNTLML